ncbi:MAG: hypothetical protein R3D27_00910 [Hyphomicrobiaceae bacterium]
MEISAEREKLAGAGVRGQMAKGPAWARDNLPREALDQIARLIDLDEQLMFRCPIKFSTSPLRPAKPGADEDDSEEKADSKPVGEPATSNDADSTGRKSRPGTPAQTPLPQRRPSGADAGGAPALRGSVDGTDAQPGLPLWARGSNR